MASLITAYFEANGSRFWGMLSAHVRISLIALAISLLIGIPAGFLCVRHPRSQKFITGLFSVLRVIPSLAILLLMVPLMGTGTAPAVVALVLLAVPPILMNTVAGLEGVAPFMLETADSLGMTPRQVWRKVRFPLAMPMILTGIKPPPWKLWPARRSPPRSERAAWVTSSLPGSDCSRRSCC